MGPRGLSSDRSTGRKPAYREASLAKGLQRLRTDELSLRAAGA